MFDLTSSKLLILGLVALIVVGPKDLPVLLRTIGKYMGLIRRQANEFRAQFDEAMRDSELAGLRAELEAAKRDATATVNDAGRAMEADLNAATRDIEHQIKPPQPVTAEPLPQAQFDAMQSEVEQRVNGTASQDAALPAQEQLHTSPSPAPALKTGA